jgi:hypothetical protein
MQLYAPAAIDVYRQVNVSYSSAINAHCEAIKKATKGLGTDERALVKVFGAVSPNDRSLIAYRYKALYGKDLADVAKSETGGDFGFLLQLAAMPLPEAEALVLHRATSGAGTNEDAVYKILLGRTAEEVEILKRTYFDHYNKDLAVVLDSELSGDMKKVIMTSLQAPVVDFKASFHTKERAVEDADKLYNAGEGKWGTDEVGFLKVLLSSPPKYVQMINEAYVKKHNKGLLVAIKHEFAGAAEDALLFHVRMALDPKDVLAELLESAMKGIGTNEEKLSVAMARYQSLLPLIDATYKEKYKSSIRDRIKGETSGDYGALLLALLDAPPSSPGRGGGP